MTDEEKIRLLSYALGRVCEPFMAMFETRPDAKARLEEARRIYIEVCGLPERERY